MNALHELVNENPAFKSDLQLKLIGKVDHTVLQSIRRSWSKFFRSKD